jgi:chromosome segregation ATPase
LHDIDANKPGGSIKIRVKTYAHSLKLATEALEDAASKRAELSRNLDAKRLELLERKRALLAARRQADAALDAEIDGLRARVASYKTTAADARPTDAPAPEPGLVALTERLDDGRRVPVQL